MTSLSNTIPQSGNDFCRSFVVVFFSLALAPLLIAAKRIAKQSDVVLHAALAYGTKSTDRIKALLLYFV